ncbi:MULTISPECIES: type II toxin-antitoxin system RelE/ParE family toxin [unclassified Methylobacterium]|uniref:type II toxin-antitoxin system RelE/ParE family toxin n=1 Tax=unclassified Methylobacterium TaxID=2615210 RepID=UPI0023780D5A|nr:MULTISPECIES: type II toxin-antitoxin system RelE/ParE family toxin [unclassified Methylobacterium]
MISARASPRLGPAAPVRVTSTRSSRRHRIWRADRGVGEYRLTQRADDDLLDLFVFGLQNFGDVQAQRYRTGLDRCFRLLADNPGLGTSRPSARGRRTAT